MSALQDRLDLMIDVVVERTDDTILTEAVDGLYKGQFILWRHDGSVIRVGSREFAKHGTSLSQPSSPSETRKWSGDGRPNSGHGSGGSDEDAD